ncbi:HAD family hydrolase [Brucepastera parasyntrophica]|uniref:HAD family hydrolase n=1 Tax=Brucepastera parasyntrophica TaxID=2880008 RepID=UPI00210C0B53|nr:HAD-IIB family hydrolase [Brucepastera parasyntrophica]
MKLDAAIIAMDMDDTLLQSDLSISDRTVQTLAAAAEKGIKIILASGRSPEAITPHARRIGLDKMNSYLFCHNGALIITSDTHEIVCEHKLPANVAVEAFRLIIDAGLSCHVYENDVIYVSKETEYSERDYFCQDSNPSSPMITKPCSIKVCSNL